MDHEHRLRDPVLAAAGFRRAYTELTQAFEIRVRGFLGLEDPERNGVAHCALGLYSVVLLDAELAELRDLAVHFAACLQRRDVDPVAHHRLHLTLTHRNARLELA